MPDQRPFPQLETENLILRELTLDDLPFYFSHFNKHEIVMGIAFPGPATMDAARAEFEKNILDDWRTDSGLRWGIIYKPEGSLVGTCGIYEWDHPSRRAEIGYDLEPTYWGRGIMTEAVKAMIRHGFTEMGLNRIQAIIDYANDRSMRLVERLGFKQEGVLRQRSYFNGEFRNDIIFCLLHKDWKE